MSFELDMTGVETWSAGDILPVGHHDVQITESKQGQSSGGHPQLELELTATGGEYEGGSIRDWIVVIPSTAGKVKQLLEALGVKVPDGSLSFEASDLEGKRAKILVREEPDQEGKPRTRVKAYEAAEGEPVGAASNGNGRKSDADDLPF